MEIRNFAAEHSILNQFMAELRDVNVQNDRQRFRTNLERIGQIMAYEVSRTLRFETRTVQTPLGQAQASVPADQMVLATIFRAGLPLYQGFLSIFDRADNAFVSAYRAAKDDGGLDFVIEYLASPNLDGKTLILVDPMLATGHSMELSLRALLTKGTPREIVLCSVIASQQGVDFVQSLADKMPIRSLWCGAIDPELNAQSYIVPGLGDAGDLAYGGKTK